MPTAVVTLWVREGVKNDTANMKFGEYLLKERNPDWKDSYLNYEGLKVQLENLQEKQSSATHVEIDDRSTSLTIPPPTNASGLPVNRRAHALSLSEDTSQEAFFTLLEKVS